MPQMPRVRMPNVSLPGRPRRLTKTKPEAPAKAKAAEAKAAEKAGNGDKPTEAKATEAKATETKPVAKKGAAKAPAPNLQERMEGLQGWMAEIERKQGRLTYFGGAAVLIAILAAGAALYFGLTAHSDSATKSDLNDLKTKVDALTAQAAKSSKDTQQALNASAAQLQASIAALQKQQAQNASSISSLQSQVASGAASKGAAGTTFPSATPGSTTTTTPKKP